MASGHQAGAYPGFRSMKRLGVFLLPPGWDASPSQGYPSSKFAGTHLYTWVERGTMGVKCLAQEHNAVPRPGLEPGPSDPESSALTIRPPRLPLYMGGAESIKVVLRVPHFLQHACRLHVRLVTMCTYWHSAKCYLNFKFVFAIFQFQVPKGIKNLEKLRVLDISHCTFITDEGLRSICQLKNLTSLNINMCTQVCTCTVDLESLRG